MNGILNKDAIIGYLSQQNPKGPLEVAKTSQECKAIMQALIALVDRLNVSRQVKLLQEENNGLQAAVKTLTGAIAQLTAGDKERAQLLKQRDALRAEQEAINDLERQRAEVEQLQAFVASHDSSALQQALQASQPQTAGDLELVNSWLYQAEACFANMQSGFMLETKALLQAAMQRRQQINTELAEARISLQQEHLQLSDLLQRFDTALNKANTEYALLSEQLNSIRSRLLEVKGNHEKNIGGYASHFAQDKQIYGELGKRHRIDEHMRIRTEEIEKALQAFDAAIKAMVEKVDHLIIY